MCTRARRRFTTIAWRLFHIASCKVVYHEYASGPRQLNWLNLERPESSAGVIDLLVRGQGLLLDDLDGLAGGPALDEPALTNWGQTWPTWRIFWTMIHEATTVAKSAPSVTSGATSTASRHVAGRGPVGWCPRQAARRVLGGGPLRDLSRAQLRRK